MAQCAMSPGPGHTPSLLSPRLVPQPLCEEAEGGVSHELGGPQGTSMAGLSPGQITSIKQAGQGSLNLPLSATSWTAALCFKDGFQGKQTKVSQIGKSIYTLG